MIHDAPKDVTLCFTKLETLGDGEKYIRVFCNKAEADRVEVLLDDYCRFMFELPAQANDVNRLLAFGRRMQIVGRSAVAKEMCNLLELEPHAAS